MKPTVGALGLGKAGGRLAHDLAAAGAEVRGYAHRTQSVEGWPARR